MSCANFDGLSDCGPSRERLLGLRMHLDDEPVGARRDRGLAPSARPGPSARCRGEGSTMTGRWVSFFSTGIALRSSVKRVEVSKVRMPRSQRITLGLPAARMYSADSRNSSMVVAMPALEQHRLADLAHRGAAG